VNKAVKRFLAGAALESHLVRVWNTIKKRYEYVGESRINYLTHSLLLAVQWDCFPNKEEQIGLAWLLARDLQAMLPEDPDLTEVILYLESRGWEKPGEGLIYDEDSGEQLIYASTITDLFATYRLMPLCWGPAALFREPK
jgi:hypothetical protein